MSYSERRAQYDPPGFLAGGGEMGERIRNFDWSQTPIGPVESWSPALRTTLRIMLANRFPHLLWWGPKYIQLYNDAYRPVPGAKHPQRALGEPASECWAEIWHILQPLIDGPFRGGPATWDDDISLEIHRHGFVEESHFTIAYGPVPDETAPGGIGGVLATVHEISEKVIGQRRVVILRDLGARVGEAKTAEEACAILAAGLVAHGKDVPFALFYLIGVDGHAHLAGASGVEPGQTICPAIVNLASPSVGGWPIFEARQSETMQVVSALQAHFPTVPQGPWSDPPDTAVVIPIPSTKVHELAGFMIAGVSARLQFDESYRDFFNLLRMQISTTIANARAYEEEKKRAEALAELDAAKTAFFSNVSHEFRTPLTLMLGPVDDMLLRPQAELPDLLREELQVVQRNGLRLLRLVNTLLDFSRIEAGRMRATYRLTDLSSFTAELAGVFRAAVERVGLQFIVDCMPLTESAYVDPDMWEKIVLNLLSNAFKFTFTGEISVSLQQEGSTAVLKVRDTGTGIPPEEMPCLFERFHRIQNARGRTHEGSGIGLALVQELVKLHRGSIEAESAVGRGTTFIVRMPLGSAHLPPGQVSGRWDAPNRKIANQFVEEALRWLPDGVFVGQTLETSQTEPTSERVAVSDRPRVVVADDNADMRQYVVRLLSNAYRVDAYADGSAALAACLERPPDLVLTDVMMPQLDGFELLRQLRADSSTSEVPVVLLSARAGEESRVEGMQTGADDYLTKPFSARELLARVSAHVRMARLRRETTESLKEADRRKDEFLATLAHELRNPLSPLRNGLQLLKLAKNDPKTLDQVGAIMERQLRHMVRLIDDLLDLSRISRGKIELRKEPVSLASVIQQAVETSRPAIDHAQQQLDISLPPQAVLVKGDVTRLAQVFSNLLNNASKFTNRGGQIWLSAEPSNGQIAVTVRDNGVGIPAYMLPRVFDMFTQVDSSLERSQGGLGIGLTLVKRLVEMHGGTVDSKSEGTDQGSEFVVHLPILPAAAAESTPDHEVPRARATTRILVVDDNTDAATTLALMLDLMGNETKTANDGLQALEILPSFLPDVVMLDIGMPRLNGYDVCRRIRREPWGKRMVIVALTGWGQTEDKRKSQEAGFDLHVVKPIDPDALEKILQDIPRRSR